jgi:hypothetical protein
MSRTSKPRPPVNLSDPAAVEAWANAVRGKLYEIHALTVEATQRKQQRKLSRRYIRSRGLRFIHDIHVALEGLTATKDQAVGAHQAPSSEG